MIIVLCSHRFVNHVPLLDRDDDVLSCAMFSGMKRCPWGKYGLKLRYIDEFDSDSLDGLHKLKLSYVYDDMNNEFSILPERLLLFVNYVSLNGVQY
jgi:hypothetical protein